jgi:hypothetical protein
MADELSEGYRDLLDGCYDCIDRIVLNGYNPLCYSAGGFRLWWRQLTGSEEQLDNAHLMRMAGRFSRRVRAFARAHSIPVIDCRRGERKHDLAEEYLATHAVRRGVFLILVARAPAPVWDVHRGASGGLHLSKKTPLINQYSFHILDATWGHLTIKLAGHPPFGAQIILNGHEYVACRARRAGLSFTKEGNCFTQFSEAARLARIAEALVAPATIGRLVQVCEQWIYSACLCFALDSAEQERTRFRYRYSIYQVEYSRNLLFQRGSHLEQVFQRMVDRTRARLALPQVKTLFGAKQRPQRRRKPAPPRLAVVLETPAYDLTVFKVHFGSLTLKAYTKGERVLRFEVVVHNTRELHCGRVVARFPEIMARLQTILDRFLTTLDCVDLPFIGDQLLDQLPLPSQLGQTRVAGVDVNQPRTRAALAAVLALGPSPSGFSVAQFRAKVHSLTGPRAVEYTVRRAAYDLKKLRGKKLLVKRGARRYQAQPASLRAIAALLILRDHVIGPLLAGVGSQQPTRRPTTWTTLDQHYERLRLDMQPLFQELGIAA